MADFEYFRAEESDQFSFFRIPKALFTEKEFQGLSTDAKLLYGILLDRISLSKKNGWIDSDGYVYIIYTIAELQDLLRMSHTTVTKLLYELDSVHGIGLIERYRQGNNRPSVIYVKNFVKRVRGKDRLHQNYLKRKASGAQKRYEDKIKAKKKAEMDAKKALIRAEDMKKGVFSTIGQLPKEEPRKGSIAASAAV